MSAETPAPSDVPLADPGHAGRAAVAWRVAAATVAFSALVQLQNYAFYAPRSGDPWADARFLLTFPFLQLQYVVAALALALLYYAARGPLQPAFWLTWLAHQLLLVSDQVFYKAFHNHLQWLVEDEVSAAGKVVTELYSSVLSDLGWTGAFNLGLTGVLLLWLLAAHWRRDRLAAPALRLSPRGRRLAFGAYVLPAALLLATTDRATSHQLEHHPLLTLVTSMVAPPSPDRPTVSQLRVRQLYRPQWGEHRESAEQREALANARRAIRGRERAPNLVLYILESVGTHQLMDESGQVRAREAPFVAQLARRAVRFDAVYPSFPSTTRAHIPMMTGGPTITHGTYTRYFDHAYTAPNLVSELKERGYAVGVFSTGDLNYERLGDFYRGLGPDVVAHYRDERESMDPSRRLNSWGVDGDEARRVTMDWVRALPPEQPFAAVFLTLATHHPYDYPSTHAPPREVETLRDKYYNALHYTDAVLRRLHDDLAAAGRLKDTVFALTGDHGQAFGLRHSGNFIHRNFLYEENVRSFLIVADPQRLTRELVSHRVGQIGDIGPTLLGLLPDGVRAPQEMPGQDLLDPGYQLRPVYFHKVTPPALLGLIDGRWKYIGEYTGGSPQLFDLRADPLERRNLAAQHPERVTRYQELCGTWYTHIGYQFIDGLPTFELEPDQARFRRSQLARVREPGALQLQVGLHPGGALESSNPIAAQATFQVGDKIVYRVAFMPWPHRQTIAYRLVREGGAPSRRFGFELPAGHAAVAGELPAALLPLEPGRYTLAFELVRRGKPAEPLITGTFEVRPR